MTPRLKVCGVADAAFAEEAARRGVDYIGVIFASASPRAVSQEAARKIAAAARAAGGVGRPRVVGVFTPESDARKISSVARAVPLDVVQLHGAFDEATAAMLKSEGLEVWKMHSPGDDGSCADALLLDGRDASGACGGTGRLADWGKAVELKAMDRKVVLAGGISCENVAAAMATGADVIDVNSSIETSPGRKSVELLERLLSKARAAT